MTRRLQIQHMAMYLLGAGFVDYVWSKSFSWSVNSSIITLFCCHGRAAGGDAVTTATVSVARQRYQRACDVTADTPASHV